jgi:hypothetical protein
MFTACEKEEPGIREFPILRTLSAFDIDTTGASFKAEVIKAGELPTSSYGFVWSVDSLFSDRICSFKLGENLKKGIFEARIDSNLFKGVTIYFRAFATQENKTIYGNILTLEGKGCIKSAWSLELKDALLPASFSPASNNIPRAFGISDDHVGYIIFQSGEVYLYNPTNNEITQTNDFPEPGSSFAQCNSARYLDVKYVTNFSNVYSFQSGQWSLLSSLPSGTFYGQYIHCVSNTYILYIVAGNESYMYNTITNVWQEKTGRTSGQLTGTNIQNRAYILFDNASIWEYNASMDKWTYKTEFPGVLREKMVSFTYNNEVYFGLGYHDHYLMSGWMNRKWWAYKPSTNTWKIKEDFPANLETSDVFFFTAENKLFMGHGENGKYNIWKYDPAKD